MWKIIINFINVFTIFIFCFLFGKYIVKEKRKLNLSLSIIFISICSIIGAYFLQHNIIKIIIFFICFCLIFKYIYKFSLKNTIILSLIYYLMLLCGDIIVVIMGTTILRINGNQLYNSFGGTILVNTIVCILAFTFCYIVKKYINKLLNIYIKNIMIIYWIIVYGTLLLFFIITLTNKLLSIETYIVLIMTFIILIIIFVSIYQKIKNNELENKYDKLLEFIKKYEIEIDKQRTMRHETKNQFLIIKSKLIDKDNETNVISYIDEIIKDNNKKINPSEYAKLRYLPSNGLKGLFYFKVDEAIENGIKVDINISKDIENSFLYNLNSNTFNQLGKILGIILDNAIEASKESKDKIIGIEIYLSKNYISFIISNSYKYISNDLKSTKGINRGHGLLLVKTIINGNNKFSNETEATDKLFIQKINLKK